MTKKALITRMLSVFLCMAVLPGLSGCWSRREPKTLGVVLSIIYDIEKDGSYKVTTELLNAGGGGAGGGSGGGSGGQESGKSNMVVVAKGDSAPEATRNTSVKAEKSIFGGHNEARFFTENFARSEMIATLDYFARDHLTDQTPLMITIKSNEPDKLYECSPCASDSIGEYVAGLSKSQPKVISQSVFVTTLDFIKDYYKEGKEPVTGAIEIVEEDPVESPPTQKESEQKTKYEAVYQGLAVYRDGKLMGFLDSNGAKFYNFVTDNIKLAFVSVPVGDGISVFGIHESKTKIKTTLKDGKVVVDLKIKVTADLIQETGTIDVSKTVSVKETEQSLNQHLESMISETVLKVQTEFCSDIFGFGAALHIQQPKLWKELKPAWNQVFSSAIVNVTVDSSVNRTGEIKQPIKLEEEP